MALWEPSLLMSICNVHSTSARVKAKGRIYNSLQPLLSLLAGTIDYVGEVVEFRTVAP
jgi:hypothetical protein